jgi:hypothetical protein
MGRQTISLPCGCDLPADLDIGYSLLSEHSSMFVFSTSGKVHESLAVFWLLESNEVLVKRWSKVGQISVELE